MNTISELVRDRWIKLKNTVRSDKKAATIAIIAALAVVVAALFVYGTGDKHGPADHTDEVGAHADEHGDHADEEAAHEGSSIVKLSEEAQKASGITVITADLESFSAPIEATAAIELNGDRVAKISARTSGRLVKIDASQGDMVKAGQALAWFDSPELGQAWAEYSKAKGRTELARQNLQREETLFEKKISPEKDVIRARQELSEAEADFAFAHEKFHLLGIDIEQYESKHKGQHPRIAVASPISGSVIERTATQGEVVGPDKMLFTVADLSTLWVILDIYEKDLSRVSSGTAVNVSTTAYAEKSFSGTISYLGEVMDKKTRTVKARVVVKNVDRLLKPGMFATVTIDAKGDKTETAIMLPDEAVFLDGTRNFIFIQTAPEKFKMREIVVGRALGNRLEVIRGLNKGASVVVRGAFILKSELKKGEFVDEHGHGE